MPTLYPFQADFVTERSTAFSENAANYALLCADTGTGKTPTSIALAERAADCIQSRRLDGQNPMILIITDASVKHQWCEQIKRWSERELGPRDVWLIDGTQNDRLIQLAMMQMYRPRFVVTNYDTIRLHLPIFEHVFGDPAQNVIIADEADRIQNMDSMRSVAVRALEAAYKIALTATPVANRANTLYPVLQFLSPGQAMMREREWNGEKFPVRYHRDAKGWGSQTNFEQTYCTFDDYGRINGSRNLPELHRRLEAFGMKRWRKRELLDLPPILYETILVDLTPSQRDLYTRLVDGLVEWIENKGKAAWADSKYDSGARALTVKSILAQLTYLRRATTLATDRFMHGLIKRQYPDFEWDSRGLTLDSDCAKSQWLKDYVESEYGEYDTMPDWGGMYVWSQWTDVVESYSNVLGEFKKRTGLRQYTGDMPDKDREATRHAVMNGECKILLSSPAGGRGVDMQRLDTAVLTDLPWVPRDIDQAVGRVDRVGQQSDRITVISVLAKDTIDTKRMLKVIQSKQADTNQILDGQRGGKSKSVLDFSDPDEIISWL